MRVRGRNNRVTFYRPEITGQNASGEDIIDPVELGHAWVKITALQGNELEAAHQIWAEARFRIEMEHPLKDYTLQRRDYFKWGSRQLDIVDVEDPDQSRRTVVIHARELTE